MKMVCSGTTAVAVTERHRQRRETPRPPGRDAELSSTQSASGLLRSARASVDGLSDSIPRGGLRAVLYTFGEDLAARLTDREGVPF